MAGLLATGIPIVFGLRPDLNEEFTQINATDTTQGQLQLIQQQLAALPALQQQTLDCKRKTRRCSSNSPNKVNISSS